MKKVGILALALGMFVAACNSAGTKSAEDSAKKADSAINAAAPAHDSTTHVAGDSTAHVAGDSTHKADSTKH